MSTSSSTTLLRCPACKEKVVVQRPSGEIVVLQRALIVKAGAVYAVCSQCRLDVLVSALEYETREIFVSADDAESQKNYPLR